MANHAPLQCGLKKYWEKHDPNTVAHALFPQPILSDVFINDSEPISLVQQWKNASQKIINELQEVYCLECTYLRQKEPVSGLFGGQTITRSRQEFKQVGNTLVLYCKTCLDHQNKFSVVLTGKLSIIESDVGTRKIPCVNVEQVFFHNNSLCCKPAKFPSPNPSVGQLRTQVERSGYTLFDIPFEDVLKGAYDTCVIQVQQDGGTTPPGDHIGNGHDGGYPFDDRTYCLLPNQDEYPGLTEESHYGAITRLFFFMSCKFCLSSEISPFILDEEMALADLHHSGRIGCYNFKKNPSYHLYPCQSSILAGGRCIMDGGNPPVHQPVHQDCTDLDSSEFKCKGRFVPGSIFVPIEDKRTIYLCHPYHKVTPVKGQAFWFDGDVFHGGYTYVYVDGRLHLALHVHLDSIHHERNEDEIQHGDVSDMAYLPKEHYYLVKDEETCAELLETMANEFVAMARHSVSIMTDEDRQRLLSDTIEQLTGCMQSKKKKGVNSKKKKRNSR